MPIFRKLSSKLKRRHDADSNGSRANGVLPAVDETKPQTVVNGHQTSQPEPSASPAPTGQANTDLAHASSAGRAATPPLSLAPNRESEVRPANRQDVESTFQQFAHLIHASRRPLPTQSGDGQYLEHEEQSGILADLRALGPSQLKTVKHILEDKASGKPQDDRKMHMEEVIQLVAALPHRSAQRVELTSAFLDELWNSLQHPPMSYLGDDFRYRSADGSNNSYIFPKLGAANTPYARSVNPVTVQPGALPDPGLLFDSLLAREQFKPHPNKVSSIFFNWASLVIHDLFQTDHRDYSISKTSSYLDLSILYGDSQEEQNEMRTFKDGKIKPDCFAEERLLAFPSACGVMLIMLNRFHNYVVEQLALINDNGRFNKPSDRGTQQSIKAAWAKYDNDLFQTGRLVTCGLYINITLYDYLRTIVNLNRTNSTWSLDPRLEKADHYGKDGTPRGVGNQVSAEFNLSYRWHSCVGEKDEQWTESVYQELFGKAPHEVSLEELMVGLGKYDRDLPKDPQKRPFARLNRGPDGKFDDGDLAQIMESGIEQVAGSFGARNIPKSMRAITILGIMQSRSWNLCTLNEYRQFFGLKTYDTFEEVNSDPYVAEQLKHLYEHPDYIELYPGLAVEDFKEPMVPGVGICPTHTISRVVLSDAVALVRGDRFYTLDWSPKNLTNWGYNEVAYDLNINQGCVFYKLMLRALPNHFKSNSIYAHYPMTVPDENAKIMRSLGRYQDYDWSTPTVIPQRLNISSYQNAQYMLKHAQEFTVMWNDGLGSVMGPEGEKFCLGGDSVFHQKQRQTMCQLIYREKWHDNIKDFYSQITLQLLHEKSCKVANFNQVDLTRDVGNLAHVHFAANMFLLPLKTALNTKGIFTEHELWMAMSVIFTAIFFDFEPTKSFPVRVVAKKLATMLGKLIEANIKSITATSFAAKFFDGFRENENALADYGVHMVRRLKDTGMSTSAIAFSQILPTAVAMVPNQSLVFTQIMDYYLGEGIAHLPEIQRWAKEDTKESFDTLLHYVNEGIRLNGTFGSYRRSKVNHVFEEDGRKITVKPGDKVFCSFVGAARDPKIFPNPDQVRLDRPLDSYIHYGIGDHTCLGKEASMVGLTAMLKTVGKLQNLRRAPGPQGQLKKIPRPGGFYVYMREDYSSHFVFPCTFKVHYDGELPPLHKTEAKH